MTLQLCAKRKEWDLAGVEVVLQHEKVKAKDMTTTADGAD